MKKKNKQIGLPPGAIVFTGDRKVEKVELHYLKYNQNQLETKRTDNQSEIIFHQPDGTKVEWYDMRGIHDGKLIELLGKTFKIHPLILEDISDVNQRPKFEEYENGNFMIIKALKFDAFTQTISTEQVAIFFRKGFCFTFQEQATDLFENIRTRLEYSKGRIRQAGADYLGYALIDALVDNYFLVLEAIEDEIEILEDLLLEQPEMEHKSKIHHLKKQLIIIRKSVMPLRDAINRLSKLDNSSIDSSTAIFIRDLYDHIIQVTDMVDSFRDMLNGLQDLFLSEVSLKMNRIMQFLTLVSTIFIPLTFLTGLYGMNFVNIPELQMQNGYFILWGIMIIISVILVFYFKKKKWI